MKKTYENPMCEIIHIEMMQLLAASVLPDSGSSPEDLMPGEGTFDGEFSSNKGSDLEIW